VTRVLVIGFGSIGQRHARVFARLGTDVTVVSRRGDVDGVGVFRTIDAALRDAPPSFAVVADETSRHRETLSILRAGGFEGPVLVEKPIFDRILPGDELIEAPAFVGYNLRFHPLALALRAWLVDKTIVAAMLHVGQHLADWRPGRDYRKSYSADATLGGGALRDLSHELDLALWLFGPLQSVAALGGNSGTLETAADDHGAILASFARCPVATITLNTLDRPARRLIHVNTVEGAITLDFIAGTLVAEGQAIAHATIVRDQTYILQDSNFLAGGAPPLCTLTEGLAALAFIDAVEYARRERIWVNVS
jgi:predicted dehydrogenase